MERLRSFCKKAPESMWIRILVFYLLMLMGSTVGFEIFAYMHHEEPRVIAYIALSSYSVFIEPLFVSLGLGFLLFGPGSWSLGILWLVLSSAVQYGMLFFVYRHLFGKNFWQRLACVLLVVGYSAFAAHVFMFTCGLE